MQIRGDLKEKPNYSVYSTKPLLPDEKIDFRKVSEFTINTAVTAANAHNYQPWRFVVRTEPRIIDVYLNPERVSYDISDVKSRQAHTGIGCSLWNLELGANYARYITETSTFPDNEDKNHIARVQFFSLDVISSQDPELVNLWPYAFQRRTNRSEYLGKEIPEEVISEIIGTTCKYPQLSLDLIGDNEKKRRIARIQEFADGYVVKTPKFAEELGEVIKPIDTEEYDGMPASGYGLNQEATIAIRKQLQQGLTSDLKDNFLIKGFSEAGANGMDGAPMLYLILGEDHRENWIKTGRLYQEMAVRLTRHGISTAMHAAQVEVGLAAINLKRELTGWRSLLKNERALGLGRLGYASEDRPHSPRYPARMVTEWVEE
jgi:hypothetical protein